MQRRLVLMRHAKSSWKGTDLRDHDRPLNKRGRRDAPRIAARLVALDWVPDAVVSSSSARTRETWSWMSAPLGDPPALFTERLYHDGLGALREVGAGWRRSWRCVLALGHNPGWEVALEALTGRKERLTTANAALLVGQGADWSEALAGPWSLEDILRPRDPR